MQKVHAEKALTSQGWEEDVLVSISDEGRITSVEANVVSSDGAQKAGILLASPANLHSHAFQRAMAGLTEGRGEDPTDSFWTWRKLMFRFLDQLTPEDIEAITAFVQMETLEAGYASMGEFHYIHHQPGGREYDALSELGGRVIAAAQQTKIGLTMLPVFYEHGGCDGRELSPGQIRFGNNPERFLRLHQEIAIALRELDGDANIGVAPHSLRAVSREGLSFAVELAGSKPFHMHLAEQVAEVDEIQDAWGARPVEWLLANHDIRENWCLIHCTQMEPHETMGLARSGVVAGLCPITESSLGDGIFDGVEYLNAGGKFGVGSDSNIRISLSEELRTLEYSQRLRDKGRAMFANNQATTGRVLFDQIAQGGAQAIGRDAGSIDKDRLADLVSLDANAVDLVDKDGDLILDTYIFAASDALVTDVWSAGRHVVKDGAHFKRDEITGNYRKTMLSLRKRM